MKKRVNIGMRGMIMWNEKEIREFERLTKPVSFRTTRLGLSLVKSIPSRLLPLLCKIGLIKEFRYEDETSNVLFNHYIGGAFCYINENNILSTVEFCVMETHHITRQYYYRNRMVGRKAIKAGKADRAQRVIGREVNEDDRCVDIIGTLTDIKIRTSGGWYENIDNLESKEVVVKMPNYDNGYDDLNRDYSFDFSSLRNTTVKRTIHAPYGAVDEEEILNIMEVMCEEVRHNLKDFHIGYCVRLK